MIEYQQQEAGRSFVQIQSRKLRVKCLVDGELSENEKKISCVAVSASRCSFKRKLSFGAFLLTDEREQKSLFFWNALEILLIRIERMAYLRKKKWYKTRRFSKSMRQKREVYL